MSVSERQKSHLLKTVSIVSLAMIGGSMLVGQAAHAQDQDEEEETRREQTIVVTGSYLGRQSQDQMASPTLTVGEQTLQASGMTNLEEVLNLNTANIGSVGGAQDLAGGGADDRATRSANLRGLGVQSTLVLLNGRRVANTDGYTNLVGLTPTIAVDRVETVLDGASALYGSDAIAGVMNVITKKDFEGIALSGQYTHIADAPGYTVQGMIGGSGEKLDAVLSFSHEYQDKLQGFERDVTNFDNTSGLAQPGNYILSSRPVGPNGGDVIIDNGVNGPINYSQLYDQISAQTGSNVVQFADPHCTVEGTGGIYAGPGEFPNGSCRFSYQQRNPVKPKARITLVHADASYDLTPEHELYFEGRYHQQGTERYGIASFPITTGTLTVPAENPYNPFGVDTQFAGRLLGNQSPDRVERVELDSIHLVGGARGPLFGLDNWNYDVFGAYSREDFVLKTSDTDLIAAQNALNGFGGPDCQISPFGEPASSEVPGEGNCVFFSPFGADQNQSDPRASYNVLTPYQRGEIGELRYLEGVITGDLFELPGGTAGVAFGAQIREEKQETFVDSGIVNARFGFVGQSSPGQGERQIESLFSEMYLPVLPTLDVQLAVRHEDYGSFTTTDPKIAANWRPVDWLALRGSYSTAFRAPDIEETVSDQVVSGVGQTVDPLDPTDTGTFRTIRTVSNPDLKPEQSENFNLGVTLNPIDDLIFSVDYFNFDFTDRIALEAAQQVINADPNGPRVQRDEFGRLLAVDIGYFNAGSNKTDGFDVRLNYSKDVGANTFTIDNMATFITTYDVQLGPNQPVIDALGGRNATNPGAPAPEFRNNLRLSWERDRHAANVLMRHTSSVDDDIGGGEVDSWTVYDVQYSYTFGEADNYRLAVGAINVLDEEPPAAAFTGYLPSLADALGRQAYVSLSLRM